MSIKAYMRDPSRLPEILLTGFVLDLLIHGLVLVLSEASRGGRDGSSPDTAGPGQRAESELRSHRESASTKVSEKFHPGFEGSQSTHNK